MVSSYLILFIYLTYLIPKKMRILQYIPTLATQTKIPSINFIQALQVSWPLGYAFKVRLSTFDLSSSIKLQYQRVELSCPAT